jgi:hypothetical protein
VRPERERRLQLDKGVGVAGEGSPHAVDFAAQDEGGAPQAGPDDGAPLDRGVDVAAPGGSASWGGLFRGGAPGFEGVAVVRRLAEPGFWVVSGEERREGGEAHTHTHIGRTYLLCFQLCVGEVLFQV